MGETAGPEEVNTLGVLSLDVAAPERWNPWATLREHDEVEFVLTDLPDAVGGAVYFPRDGWAGIAIDRRLTRVDRNAALAHELAHHRRGGGVITDGMPEQWCELVARDERAVHNEVARRLVPLEELASLIASIVDDGQPVEVWEIAEAFEVPDDVARRAMQMLRDGAPVTRFDG